MRSSVLRAAAAITTAGLLTACGATAPGVAADVNGQRITDQQVDDFARVLCSLGALQATSAGTPTSQARAQALQILMSIAVTRQMTGGRSVDQARVSTIEQQMNSSRSSIPESQRRTFDSVVAEFARSQSAVIDLGRRALEKQGKSGPISDQQAFAEGSRLRTAYAAKADIEVDPRFGTVVNGVLKPGSGSLSVPVSQTARDAVAPSPVSAHVSQLPASLKCG